MMLKRLILTAFALCVAGLALAEPPAMPLPWVKLSEIYYTPTQVRMYGANDGQDCVATICNAVYVQTHLPANNFGWQFQGVPVTVDLAPYGVPADAKVAWLSGILIITHGTTTETADIHVTFAAAGDPIDCNKYISQAAEAYTLGGQRSGISTMVPLNGGKFQFCYYLSTPGAWPNNSAYAINLSLQAWGR